ncbi:2-hydroxyacid dehydrogenase [Frigidibacter sp. ROC022]|uniref:2-hydroxyacid dehydrogenase n=1 Tax=Frigidibacter sp. ROC022 TaxID=2971796 RepID=UPI00215B0FBC|nr:glyoxylate/hydroxypyruvate reductase A [Frigidibacter sp. ROC022]MCR8726616.1 glyoxylate/hydroxypyruvate reductase A [Frigidibacter sp. ROC022]
MTLRILFSAPPDFWADYAEVLPEALAAQGLQADLAPVGTADWAPETVDYLVFAPSGPISDFSVYTNAKAVLSLWAGVETVVGNPTLTQPLCRMVDVGIAEGMMQWVVAHVLRHHVGLDAHVVNPGHLWKPTHPPLTHERPIGVLGLGELGQVCAKALAGLGFPVSGWSRNARDVPGIDCQSGPEGLETVLRRSEILVLLLPKTPETENILDARRLALMPEGAVIVNPGRGALIDDAALIATLDSGRIGHATLDVFRTEPLPQDHPFWAHPRVTVTPHVAATTRPATASKVIAENIRRNESGEPLLYRVDRAAGY